MDTKAFIRSIAKPVGGIVAMSKALGLSRGAVSQWDKVPAERLLDVERVTGVPREKLRPDLFVRALPSQDNGAISVADRP